MLTRFGVSFISTAQACANAQEEVPDWNWDAVQSASVAKWQNVLQRVSVDVDLEDPTVMELLYSSVSQLHMLYDLPLTSFKVLSYITSSSQYDTRESILGIQQSVL